MDPADLQRPADPSRGPVRELSVFFPFFNEDANIQRVVDDARRALDDLGLQWEMVLVDDGSADRTPQLADRIAAHDSRIRAVHHPENRGYGAALQTGFRAARLPWVFYTDGDGQFDLADLARVLPLAERFDVVSAYRENRREGFLRRAMAAAWGWLTGRLLGFRIRDVDAAFKLYRREIFDRIPLHSTGALIDAEILARAARAGYTIGQTPVRHFPRRAGTPTGAKPTVILRAFRELWRLRKDIRAQPPRES